MKIIKNAVWCRECKCEIESKYTHDFVVCPGKHVAVEGGRSYLKRVFFVVDGKYIGYEERSISDPPPETTNIVNEIATKQETVRRIRKERARLEFDKPKH